MWIKLIRLEGFKSYKDLTEIPLKEGSNLILGRNGAGKSNLLNAISNILDVPAVTRDNRQELLHPNATQAWIEITYDNSSKRLPLTTSEVVVMRTFTYKSDDMKVNGKARTRKDVQKMFKTAGISDDNRFNVVRTGDVNAFCTSSDTERLKQVEELAGATVYKVNQVRTAKIMKRSQDNLEEVATGVEEIDRELVKLKDDTKDLKKYQKADQVVKFFEHGLKEREVENGKKKLKEMDNNFQQLAELMAKGRKKVEITAGTLEEMNAKLTTAMGEKNELEDTKSQLIATIDDVESTYTKTRQQIKDAGQELQAAMEERDELQNELDGVEVKRLKTQGAVEKIAAQLDREAPAVETLEAKVASHRRRLDAGRGGADDLLKSMESNKKGLEQRIAEWEKEVEETGQALAGKKEEHLGAISTVADLTTDLEASSAELEELKISRQTCMSECISSTEDAAALQSRQRTAIDRVTEVHNQLMMRSGESKHHIRGIKAVDRILRTFDQDPEIANGYCGVLADCFDMTDEGLSLAVSSVAGKRLFYHVVTTKHVVNRILRRKKEMLDHGERDLEGEMSFIPLDTIQRNFLRPEVVEILRKSKDGKPFIKLLRPHRPEYQPALDWIFGKHVLVRDTAAFKPVQQSVQHAQMVDCVTMEGDQASSKGVISGGYLGKTSDKLAMYKSSVEARSQADQVGQQLDAANEALRKSREQLETVNKQISKVDRRRAQMETTMDEWRGKVKALERELADMTKRHATAEAALTAKKSELGGVVKTLEDAEADRADNSQGVINMEAVAIELKELQIELRTKQNELNNTRKKKGVLDSRLKDMIQPKVDEKRAAIESNKNLVTSITRKGENLKHLLDQLKCSKVEKASKCDELDQKLDAVIEKCLEWQSKLEDYQKKYDKTLNQFKEARDEYDVALEKKKHQEEVVKEAIEQLGQMSAMAPTSEAYREKFNEMTTEECKRTLDNARGTMDRLQVDFTAIQRFERLTEQRETICRREAVIVDETKVVEDLLKDIDEQKREKTEFTLRQIGKYFEENFKILAPDGSKGELQKRVTQRPGFDAGDGSQQNETQEDLSSQASYVTSVTDRQRSDERIVGILINVRFPKAKAYQDIRQLSGGQKAVVALSLVLAFQRCSQAPICILDEVDAAIDSDRRKKLAHLIGKESKGAQYITTTFRKELLATGNQFVGIKFENRVSRVTVVDQEEAKQFVR